MKKLFYLAIGLILCFTMCNDKEEDCSNGYEGANCNTEMRSKFYGTYVGILSGGGMSENVQTTMSEFPGDVMKIKWDDQSYLIVTGSTTFDIPYQSIEISGVVMSIVGGGSLSGSTLTATFDASVSGSTLTLTFSGTKQKSLPSSKDALLWVKVEDLLN